MSTAIIGLKELRTNTEKYIGAVKRGRSFTVVRRSAPVFHIAPVPVDEWGDTGTWETVLNLRGEPSGGIEARKLLRMMQKIDAKQRRKISAQT